MTRVHGYVDKRWRLIRWITFRRRYFGCTDRKVESQLAVTGLPGQPPWTLSSRKWISTNFVYLSKKIPIASMRFNSSVNKVARGVRCHVNCHHQQCSAQCFTCQVGANESKHVIIHYTKLGMNGELREQFSINWESSVDVFPHHGLVYNFSQFCCAVFINDRLSQRVTHGTSTNWIIRLMI